jgi:sulfatase maturation enzyme AslB (radical SAM superfamily)
MSIELGHHLKLALRYFEEGKNLVDKDSAQASEKLYKAAEEIVKMLTMYFNLSDVLENVKKRGRWTVAELERAVEAISERFGEWFISVWDIAWALHVWGFHEAKLDSKAVKVRLPYLERMILETQKLVEKVER